MKRKIWVILGIFIWVSGCSLAPKYTQPKSPIPANWPKGAAYKNHQTTISAIPETSIPRASIASKLNRHDFFTDKYLVKIIEIALDNNRDLRLASLNVEKVRGMYGIQRSELYPVVNAVGGGSKQRLPADLSSTGIAMTEEQYSVNLGVSSWEIDFFGRLRSLKEQALQAYLSTDEARRSAQIALVSEVGRTYYTLAAGRENLKLAISTFKAQQNSYNLIQNQYKAGLANELDLRRAQTQVESARGKTARYTQQVAQAQNALNLLAGSYVPEKLLPAGLNDVKPPENIFCGLSSDVLLNRPDIMAAEHQLKGAYAFIGAARASFFPRIALTAGLGTASSELSGLFKAGSGTWSFAPRVAMPIFDARTWAAYRVSKAERKIALTRYEKTIQTAFREVADALAVRGTIDRQVSAQQSLVNALAATYSLSRNRYINGIDSYLSVLDAQRSLFGAQQGLISLRLVKLANQVRLYAVLGGGGN